MAYVVTSPITRLGRSYAVGDPIEPLPHEVVQLVAAGCIKEVPPPLPVDAAPPPSAPAPEAPREVRAASERGPHKKPSIY